MHDRMAASSTAHVGCYRGQIPGQRCSAGGQPEQSHRATVGALDTPRDFLAGRVANKTEKAKLGPKLWVRTTDSRAYWRAYTVTKTEKP